MQRVPNGKQQKQLCDGVDLTETWNARIAQTNPSVSSKAKTPAESKRGVNPKSL
jgi:hypothetical protein